MKKVILLIVIFTLASGICVSEEPRVKVNDSPIPYHGNVRWGNDLLVSPSEPMGRPSAIYRSSNSTIYVSIPDTNIQANSCVVILSSSDNGASWLNISSLSPASIVPKTKMVISALDSVYCFLQLGTGVYCWNVLNNRIAQIKTGGYRDFDAAASSSGSMYVFVDSLGTNGLFRYGSPDGGVTWGNRGNISSGAAFPKISFSPFGDTLTLNYYGPVLADTATSIIRNVRYRETAPGIMAVVGSFSDIAKANARKQEFSTVRYGNSVWFFYTHEESGNSDIRCKISTNGGLNYTDSTIVDSVLNTNEYWFDAKYHHRGDGGADIIHYSIDGGAAMNYSTVLKSNMLSFSTQVQFSENPPVVSSTLYYPTLIEYYGVSNDAGAIWVGNDGGLEGGNKLFFDRLLRVSTLNLAMNFEACPSTDTITVELHKSVSPYNMIESKKGLGGQGISQVFNLTNPQNGTNYYLVVKHRNSIETWSKSGGEQFTSNTLTYDFTSAATQAFGSNLVLVSGEYSNYTGDPNQDGIVDATDIVVIYNDASAGASGYVATDLNCDDIVDVSDIIFCYNNSVQVIQIFRP